MAVAKVFSSECEIKLYTTNMFKNNKVTLEASLAHYSHSAKGCVRFVCVSSYMMDIRLYPSFHQLSEEESSSRTLQSDPDLHTHIHTHIHYNTHSSRKADTLHCEPSLISAKPHCCFPLVTTVITHAAVAPTPIASIISLSQYHSISTLFVFLL